MSYQSDNDPSPAEDVSQHVKSRSTWVRLVFMLLFAVAALQFLFMLFSGETNERLTRFGLNLARFIQQVAQFLTCNTEVMPFPFSDWPDEEPGV